MLTSLCRVDKIIHLRPEQERDRSLFIDPETQTEMEVVESQLLLDWLAIRYRQFGAVLEIVTDKSQEGSQFVRGFGGIGGMSSSSYAAMLLVQD